MPAGNDPEIYKPGGEVIITTVAFVICKHAGLRHS